MKSPKLELSNLLIVGGMHNILGYRLEHSKKFRLNYGICKTENLIIYLLNMD